MSDPTGSTPTTSLALWIRLSLLASSTLSLLPQHTTANKISLFYAVETKAAYESEIDYCIAKT